MTKDELLQELSQQTYVALRPSHVHGIGVFAVREIPKGCRDIFSNHTVEWIKVPIREVEQLPEHSRTLVETYCLYDEHHYFVPEYGFKIMDMVNYLNHSSSPNVISVNHGEYFEALQDIPVGAELLVNYSEIVEGTEGYD
jgi:SET domain-containing protein